MPGNLDMVKVRRSDREHAGTAHPAVSSSLMGDGRVIGRWGGGLIRMWERVQSNNPKNDLLPPFLITLSENVMGQICEEKFKRTFSAQRI